MFIDGRFVEPASGSWFPTVNPATEDELAEVAEAAEEDVDLAVTAARTASEGMGGDARGGAGQIPLPDRTDAPGARREFAVVETMDGGKPIRESRDVDLPLVAAHFFYHAGWADKLEYAFPGLTPEPLGCCRSGDPVELPHADAGLEGGAGARHGEHGGAQAGRDHTAHRPHVRRAGQRGRATSRRAQRGHRWRGDGQRRSRPSRGRQGGIHRLDVGGEDDPAPACRDREAANPGAWRQGAHVIFDDAPLDQAIEGVINGIFFNQGHVCCAGSRLLVQESIHDVFVDKLKERLATLRVGDPLDKNTDVGAINSSEQLDKITELVRSGEARAPRCTSPSALSPPTASGSGRRFSPGCRRATG